MTMAMDVQAQCELGQEQLSLTRYIEAEATLAAAEQAAWRLRDFDALRRLYMPLQEARRQRRQRCGEGVVCLDLLAEGPADDLEARHVVENYPHGQLLVAGWGSIEPAVRVRQMAEELGLYVETFLGAVYAVGSGRAVLIVPLSHARLPEVPVRSVEDLAGRAPANSLVLRAEELPAGSRKGDAASFGSVMAMWERLHTPFVAAADAQTDPVARMEGYRTAIRVDYACELAHQKLSDVAREMARRRK